MRKIFRTAVSLAMGCALLSTSAFAAVTKNDDGTVNVTVDQVTAGEQVALVLVKGESQVTELPDLSVESNLQNVVYIDQNGATGSSITFENINVGDAKTVSAFAGYSSNTDTKAAYAGGLDLETSKVQISVDDANVTAGSECTIAYNATGDAANAAPVWYVNDVVDTSYITAVDENTPKSGYKFKTTKEGQYTIKAVVTVGTKAISSDPIAIVVTKAAVAMVENSNKQTDILTNEELGTDNLYGFGAAMKINVPSSITLQKMIWVLDAKLGDDTEATRKFSESVDISELSAGVSGDISVAATFVAGAKNNDKQDNVTSVDSVGALFLDSNGIEYSTIEDFDFDASRAK